MAGGVYATLLLRSLREARSVVEEAITTAYSVNAIWGPKEANETISPEPIVSDVPDVTWPWTATERMPDVDGCNATEPFRSNASLIQNASANASEDVLRGYPYPSLYSWQHIILSSIVVTIIMMVIVLGNTLVIAAVATDRNLKGVQNWFITSLAVSDLLVGLFIMPLSLANELMGYWIFGDILCELWLAIDVLLCTASILNLCLISLDRYWSVTRAVSYVKTRTRKRAIVMIAIVWLMSMIICLPPLAGWKRPQPTKYGYPLCVLSEEPGYVAYSTMGSFYIPLIVMVLVYFKIYLAARSRARRNLKKKSPPRHLAGNGKSTSAATTNTTTTTTSFSNPCRIDAGKLSPTKEFSSEEEPSAGGSAAQSSQSGSRGSQTGQQVAYGGGVVPREVGGVDRTANQLLVGGDHTAVSPGSDEKRQLLSGDDTCETDSTAVDTLSGRRSGEGDGGRRIHFSEDTDSHSDLNTSTSQLAAESKGSKAYKEGSGGEDNLRPLLEESDSQRESDKNSNSLLRACDIKPGHPLPVTRLPNVTVGSGKEPTSAKQELDQYGSNYRTSLKAPLPQHVLLSPAQIKRHLGGTLAKKIQKEAPKPSREDPERLKRKIARAKERRATIVLGIIMATFICCWLPFFSIYLVVSFAHLSFPPMAFAVFFWFGYVNSALNPIIYTIFNRDFKNAFHKIIFGRKNAF
ncbi:hypothetical protein LSH36_29g11020 [Paralvinella palmiformis]|uniref:G-protein coupled receptors family 1 profile domain-containing protein n=1 Tax=Paralvinella palmiformis TaxID=53620 RepID=A0AAD9K954_9ANNE|nr:hypothetical protein LSH36_29g11020 [Paralvinella palmiformis]